MVNRPTGKLILLARVVIKETLIKFFDKLRMNGNLLIIFVVSLSVMGIVNLFRAFLRIQYTLSISSVTQRFAA